MEALEFKIQGKMAHFRKYFSNSTALSYHIPPVVTVKGILAGLLGRERDSYYEEFSNKNCRVAIGVDLPLKKITQTVNLLKIEKVSDLSSPSVHTQNNTEWVVPQDIQTGILSYTIVVSHRNVDIMNELHQKICTLSEGYLSEGIALALGSAQCQGWIAQGRKIELSECIYNGEKIASTFAIPISVINSVNPYCGSFSVKKEETITEFDSERYITTKSKEDIIVSGNGKPLLYELKPETVYWKNENENLILLGDIG